MSEYHVNAYFLEKDKTQKIVGSKNEKLIAEVLKDESGIIDSVKGRASGKEMTTAVKELINGNIEEKFPYHYAYATWAAIAVITEERPNDPMIGYPFIDLYDFVEMLENHSVYPKLKAVFASLNGDNSEHNFPIDIGEWASMPCITYVETIDDEMVAEAKQMKKDIEDFADWSCDWELDYDDVEQLLGWIEEAHEQKKSLCMVMDGDL